MIHPTQSPFILIAEDDVEDILILKEAFKEFSFTADLFFVNNGEELVAFLNASPLKPEFIITDLNMPRMNGLEVLAYLKKSLQYNRTPIIILSTSQKKEEVDLCLSLGAEKFFRKPETFNKWAPIVEVLKELLFVVR